MHVKRKFLLWDLFGFLNVKGVLEANKTAIKQATHKLKRITQQQHNRRQPPPISTPSKNTTTHANPARTKRKEQHTHSINKPNKEQKPPPPPPTPPTPHPPSPPNPSPPTRVFWSRLEGPPGVGPGRAAQARVPGGAGEAEGRGGRLRRQHRPRPRARSGREGGARTDFFCWQAKRKKGKWLEVKGTVRRYVRQTNKTHLNNNSTYSNS